MNFATCSPSSEKSVKNERRRLRLPTQRLQAHRLPERPLAQQVNVAVTTGLHAAVARNTVIGIEVIEDMTDIRRLGMSEYYVGSFCMPIN